MGGARPISGARWVKQPDWLTAALQVYPGRLAGRGVDRNDSVAARCHADLVMYESAVRDQQVWAITMADSDGRVPAGVRDGARHWLGSYEQCERVTATRGHVTFEYGGARVQRQHDFDAKYCRVFYMVEEKYLFSLGICVPDLCEAETINHMISATNQTLVGGTRYHTECPRSNHPPFGSDPKAISATILLALIATVVLVATVYDSWSRKRSANAAPKIMNVTYTNSSYTQSGDSAETVTPSGDQSARRGVAVRGPDAPSPARGAADNTSNTRRDTGIAVFALVSFSLLRTIRCLLPSPAPSSHAPLGPAPPDHAPRSHAPRPGSFTCLDGIRVVSCYWIVLGHTWVIDTHLPAGPLAVAVDNDITQYRLGSRLAHQIIENMSLAVDGFFLLSATLVSVSLLKQLNATNRSSGHVMVARYYFRRYWRLTPVYAVLIAVGTCLFHHVTTGPLMVADMSDVDNCRQTWWMNMLYINNFPYNLKLCYGWTWYLATEFQFYAVAPLFMYILNRRRLLGALVLLTAYACSLAARAVLYTRQYPIGSNEWFVNIYFVPWCRFGPYAIGLALGTTMHVTKCKVRMRKVSVVSGWSLSIVLLAAAVVGTYGHSEWSAGLRAGFLSLQRDVFALALAWVVFACCTGHGGVVNKALSWRGFAPLARLTYVVYLLHPLVIHFFTYSRMRLLYVQDSTMTRDFFAYLLISNLLASLLHITIEVPMMQLGKLMSL